MTHTQHTGSLRSSLEGRARSLAGVTTLLALGGLLAFSTGCGPQQAAANNEPLEVSVVEVEAQNVVVYTDFVGTVDGVENAQIRARVGGYLEEVHFKEGSRVKKDDLLFTIDPVLSQAEVRAAQGDLAMARAASSKSKADVDRLTPLVATNAVSRQELDHAVASKESADAQIIAAQGALASAQASLDYTKVKSPIDGIVGVREASIGDLVGKAEPTLLTTVSQLDTVRVRFPISEQLYLQHAQALNRLVDNTANKFRLELILADGSTYAEAGWLALIDRSVSIATGSIMLEARFPNPKGLLRPGQFARVRAATARKKDAIGVPQRAVIERQSMHELFVLEEGNKVARRAVTVGEKVGSSWLIVKGLKPKDKVLIEGVQKVKAGMIVKPRVVPQQPISPPKGPMDEAPPEEEGATPGDAPAPDGQAAPTGPGAVPNAPAPKPGAPTKPLAPAPKAPAPAAPAPKPAAPAPQPSTEN